VPNLPGHETSVFPVSPERLPHLVASYNMEGDMEDLSSWVTHYDGDHTFEYVITIKIFIAFKNKNFSCN
jgi:hypothetical protein